MLLSKLLMIPSLLVRHRSSSSSLNDFMSSMFELLFSEHPSWSRWPSTRPALPQQGRQVLCQSRSGNPVFQASNPLSRRVGGTVDIEGVVETEEEEAEEFGKYGGGAKPRDAGEVKETDFSRFGSRSR